jgi:hypothetical protein
MQFDSLWSFGASVFGSLSWRCCQLKVKPFVVSGVICSTHLDPFAIGGITVAVGGGFGFPLDLEFADVWTPGSEAVMVHAYDLGSPHPSGRDSRIFDRVGFQAVSRFERL